MDFNKIFYNISIAMDLAFEAEKAGEVPVGAIVTDRFGKVLAKAYNTKEREQNPCYHAEILAISEASKYLNSWRLNGCEMFVTLEPCTMCMGAIIQSRLANVYFGAYDTKAGSISLGFNLHQNLGLNHRVGVYGGFYHKECSKQLSNFFKCRRKNYC